MMKHTQMPIVKALQEGLPSMGLKKDTIVFIVSTDEFGCGGLGSDAYASALPDVLLLSPDVRSLSHCVALWKIGDAAVGLWLVQLASVYSFFVFHALILYLLVIFGILTYYRLCIRKTHFDLG